MKSLFFIVCFITILILACSSPRTRFGEMKKEHAKAHILPYPYPSATPRAP